MPHPAARIGASKGVSPISTAALIGSIGDSVQVPLTVQDIGVQAFWDFSNLAAYTLSGNSVVQLRDMSGNDYHLNAVNSLEPTYNATTERLVTTETTRFNPVTVTADSILMVTSYKDGLVSTFDDYKSIICAADKFILGNPSSNVLYVNSSSMTADAFIDGSSASTGTVLPMPEKLLRFAFTAITREFFIMSFALNQTSRGWPGSTAAYVIPNIGETPENLQKLEGILAHKYGHTLDVGHPYHAGPPIA